MCTPAPGLVVFRCCCGRNVRTSLRPGVGTIISLLYFFSPSRRAVQCASETGHGRDGDVKRGKACMQCTAAPLQLRSPIDITVVIHGQLTQPSRVGPLLLCFLAPHRTDSRLRTGTPHKHRGDGRGGRWRRQARLAL
ncbi:hypothetical protein SEVIR_5G386550v4 [Setaria viridis]